MLEQEQLRDDLRKYLEENGVKQNHIAKRMGNINASIITRFLQGRYELSIKLEQALRDIIY